MAARPDKFQIRLVLEGTIDPSPNAVHVMALRCSFRTEFTDRLNGVDHQVKTACQNVSSQGLSQASRVKGTADKISHSNALAQTHVRRCGFCKVDDARKEALSALMANP